MQKWTSSSGASAAAVTAAATSVSLRRVVTERRGPLNEVEAWAVLSQAGSALQDILLGVNNNNNNNNNSDKSSTVSLISTARRSSPISPSLLVATPDTLMCTASGRIVINQTPTIASEYVRPGLRNRMDLGERELEALGIYSLGKTVEECLNPENTPNAPEVSQALRSLLEGMTKQEDPCVVTLFSLLHVASEQWRLKVGSSPISRFVSQLCRITLGWQVRPYQGLVTQKDSSSAAYSSEERKRKADEIRSKWLSQQQQILPPPPPPPRQSALPSPPPHSSEATMANKRSDDHDHDRVPQLATEEEVEFSRLDASSSSSSNSPSHSPKLPSEKETSSSVPDLCSAVKSSDDDDNRAQIGFPQVVVDKSPVSIRRHAEAQPSAVKRMIMSRRRSSARHLEAEDRYENVHFSSNLDKAKSASEQNCLHHRSSASRERGYEDRRAMSAVGGEFGRQPVSSATVNPSSRQQDANRRRRGAENNPSSTTTTTTNGNLNGQSSGSSQCSIGISSENSSSNRVRRNPSRLYRVVRPLAQVTPTPSPATKRCVGPEFVVMAAASSEEAGHTYLDLSRRFEQRGRGGGGSMSSSDQSALTRQATVVMLGGKRIVCRVSPHSVTAGEVLDNVLSNQVRKYTSSISIMLKLYSSLFELTNLYLFFRRTSKSRATTALPSSQNTPRPWATGSSIGPSPTTAS